MPKKLNTNVGNVKNTVKSVNVFIVLFISFDSNHAYEVVILSNISV